MFPAIIASYKCFILQPLSQLRGLNFNANRSFLTKTAATQMQSAVVFLAYIMTSCFLCVPVPTSFFFNFCVVGFVSKKSRRLVVPRTILLVMKRREGKRYLATFPQYDTALRENDYLLATTGYSIYIHSRTKRSSGVLELYRCRYPIFHDAVIYTENTVPLVLWNCCIRVCWGDHVTATEPLRSNDRCLQRYYLATAVV